MKEIERRARASGTTMILQLVKVITVGVLAGATATFAQGDKDVLAHRELKAMAGTWKEISRQRDGQLVATNELGTMTQDELGSAAAGRLTYTVRVDPTASPKTIDYIVTGGAVVRLGIYELNGDTLRICLARPGAARPKEFASPARQDLVLSVYRRAK